MKIFLSYRRDDTFRAVKSLAAKLRQLLPSADVFMDTESIPIGVDFVETLRRKVDSCDVMLVIIGKHWISALDENGKKRLLNKDDFVRVEIQKALEAGKRLVPVLIDGALMPSVRAIPKEMSALLRRQFARVDHESEDQDLTRLVAALNAHAEAITQGTNIVSRVKRIVIEQLSVEPERVVFAAAYIDDLGADSLDLVELVMAFEEEFGIEIPDSLAEHCNTVGDTVAGIQNALLSHKSQS